MRTAVLLASLILPTTVFAAGGDDDDAPSTPSCQSGYVYDSQTRTCVRKSSSLIDDTERYTAVREYAYAGDLDSASAVLDSMTDQASDAVMTYRGFIARKNGDMIGAMRAYHDALEVNPDNLLARSYMAQGLVTLGDLDGAQQQHEEILARGGAGTWAEVSLAHAIATGEPYNY